MVLRDAGPYLSGQPHQAKNFRWSGPRPMCTIPRYCPTCFTSKKSGYGAIPPTTARSKPLPILHHVPRTSHKPGGSRHRTLTDEERARNRIGLGSEQRWNTRFGIIKQQFRFSKVRYRGPDKNALCFFVARALINVEMARKTLLRRSRLGLQEGWGYIGLGIWL